MKNLEACADIRLFWQEAPVSAHYEPLNDLEENPSLSPALLINVPPLNMLLLNDIDIAETISDPTVNFLFFNAQCWERAVTTVVTVLRHDESVTVLGLLTCQ